VKDGIQPKHTGLAPVVRLAVRFAFLGFLIGCAYGIAFWYSPFVLINFALTAGVACLLGYLVAQAAIAKVLPSTGVHFALGFFAGLVAVYASWGTNAAIRIPGVLLEGFRPGLLYGFAQDLYRFSSVNIVGEARDDVIEGTGLIVLWVLEGAVITVGSAVLAIVFFRNLAPPICDVCAGFQNTKHGIVRLKMPDDVDALLEQMCAGDLDFLEQLAVGSLDDDPHVRIDVAWCPECNETCALSASIISYESQPSEMCLLRDDKVSPETIEFVRSRASAESEDSEVRNTEVGEHSQD
jgi:hypothetical protein